MKFTAVIHNEGGVYWATVDELPGVFAAGDTWDELRASLGEGISAVLPPEAFADATHLSPEGPVEPDHAEHRILELC